MDDTLRLFLVEDDDDFAYLMRKSLERAGHQVTVCHAGADALIVLGHDSFHLVILDQRLPDMAGLDLLQTMRKEGIATPVLFVTGYGDEALATQVLHAGALDYVVKDRALTFLTDLPKRVHEAVTRNRLQQTNRLLIEALESARDGILITDLQGTILHVNQALEGMYGYDRREMLGNNPRIFRSEEHSEDFFADLWRTILGRLSWQGEIVNRRKDGTLLDTSLTISPLLDGRGQLTHFVGIFRDITDRKQMERQLFQAQKMQSVGTLAGGVAHEFNNLLAGIQGYATLGLREPGIAPALKEFLGYVVELSERAAQLTRQLLAFARKPALVRHPTSMVALLQNTAELVARTLKVEVRLDLPEDAATAEDLQASADHNQLQQVLVNLALNARDSLADGHDQGVVFRLRRHRSIGEKVAFPVNIPPGDYVVLEVEDRGCGMAPQILAQALDPFFTTKEVGQGTGLGLPVAFGIINGHQGYLAIDSQVGHGTTVAIYLPRLAVPQVASYSRPERPAILEPEQATARRILVVDDERAVLDVVRRFLEIAGHQVHAAHTGGEGAAYLETGLEVDLIILDLMIPREQGLQNYRAFRRLAPHVSILLCTGQVQLDQANRLLEAGATEILLKPFRMNELWHAVERSLRGPSPGV